MSEAAPALSEDAPADRLPPSILIAYALPMAGFSAATMMISIHLLKYSADVLLIAPGAMGLIFGLARGWDGLTDPVAGQWSAHRARRATACRRAAG